MQQLCLGPVVFYHVLYMGDKLLRTATDGRSLDIEMFLFQSQRQGLHYMSL